MNRQTYLHVRLLPLWLIGGVFLLALSACGKDGSTPAKSVARPENVSVTVIHMGLGIGKYNRVVQEKNVFAPKDTIILSVGSDGSVKTATIGVKWMTANGKVLAENSQDIIYNGSVLTPFSFSKAEGLPAGKYKAEVTLNGWLAETTTFEVKLSPS